MTQLVLKGVISTIIAATLSLYGLQARAQNIVTIQNVSHASNLQLGPPMAMPTANAQGLNPLKGFATPFSHSGSGNSGLPRGRRYPGDLQYHGGAVVPTAVQHTIFVNPSANCPPNSCWGNPIGFLNDLSNSGMIHVTDQYVGSNGSGRYPVGTNFAVSGYTPVFPGTAFTDLDIALIAYNVGLQTSGLGLGHHYHVFLVPGQDLCFDNSFSVCYSPDVPSSFFFCGYHGYASDSAGNTVLYTAEPYQDVDGCSARPDGPNGQVTDSTNNVLSHEVFEIITDPFGTGWWNSADNGLFGQEIGDECSFLFFTSTNVYFGPNFVRLNGKPYAVQPEYSNMQKACATSTSD